MERRSAVSIKDPTPYKAHAYAIDIVAYGNMFKHYALAEIIV